MVLEYDKDGRLIFTKEMKKEYTILVPQMLPVTFAFLLRCLELDGYKVELLTGTHKAIPDTGLKYVHNDTCYPALLVIGQMIEAVQSGRYDTNKIALMITQTGGGCRASNYIHLLRKALKKAGLEHIPVISLNLSGFEKNPGFKLHLRLLIQMIFSMMYGDAIVNLANQCRPYEITSGSTDGLVQKWQDKIIGQFTQGKGTGKRSYIQNLIAMTEDFAALPVKRTHKPLVGVVGEIYVKYAPLGNNNLEQFLQDEGCEVVVPGLVDFIIFKANNRIVDVDLYGGSRAKKFVVGLFQNYLIRRQAEMIAVFEKHRCFRAPGSFDELKRGVSGFVGYGNKMGEGWLLTGEMLELIHQGISNIVCTQPFGCLPNHIVGKGMIHAIREKHLGANIVAIDYDPGASRINQENRIKLMLSNAKNQLKFEEEQYAKADTANFLSEIPAYREAFSKV